MSLMCKMNSSCEAKPGMCVHEKMMLGLAVVGLVGAAGLWFFG